MKYRILVFTQLVTPLLLIAQGKQPLMDIWSGIDISSPLVMQLIHVTDRAPAAQSGSPKPVLSPSCEFPPRPLQLSPTDKELTSSTMNLKAPSYYMRDLLAVLAFTKVGKPIAQRFLPAFESGELQVLLATHEELMSRFKKDSIVAFCEVSDNSRKIYIDKTAETGTVAPIFLHELVHCLDPEQVEHPKHLQQTLTSFNQSVSKLLESTAKRTGKPIDQLALSDFNASDMNQIRALKDEVSQFAHIASFRTERKAYDAGYAAGQELLQRFPEYYKNGTPFLKAVLAPTSDDQIVERYNLNPAWVDMYKKGQCRSL